MAYTKTTNFLAKDSLLSGDPAKLVKGSEIDTEFTAIQTADALNVKRDGSATIAANIPMNNFKLTGLAAGSTAGDSVRYEQFASPPSIGGTAAAAGTFTTLGGTTITASTQFSGPGTGLTGTAASLAIGGNAATATTSTNISGGAAGQILYQSGSGATAKLTAGAATQVIIGGAATPAWQTSRVVRQVLSTTDGALATGTTAIPADDTIPQNTEGDQYMSLAITPQSATSTLVIDVNGNFSHSVGPTFMMALFQDTTANALAVTTFQGIGTSFSTGLTMRHIMTSGTTSATTFKVRAGSSAGGTTTFNGANGLRLMGGVMSSNITITEYLP